MIISPSLKAGADTSLSANKHIFAPQHRHLLWGVAPFRPLHKSSAAPHSFAGNTQLPPRSDLFPSRTEKLSPLAPMLASNPEKNECVRMDVPCRGTLTCTNEGKGENEGMCPKPETADVPSSQTHSTPSLQGRAGGGSALSRTRARTGVFCEKRYHFSHFLR